VFGDFVLLRKHPREHFVWRLGSFVVYLLAIMCSEVVVMFGFKPRIDARVTNRHVSIN
jgi:hypothetical protein